MRIIVLYVCALTLLTVIQSCGRASTSPDQYTETITWTEGGGDDAWNGSPEEMSDSELVAEELTEEDPNPDMDTAASADTAVLREPVTSAVAESGSAVTITSGGNGRLRLRRIGRLHEVFNDSNHFQLEHARRLGIEPMTGIGTYYNTRRPLVKVETNRDFVVDELRHSYPYLVPEAERLLHDIGRNFQDSLASRGGGRYRIIVTSVLRTPVTVKRLRRVNGNATQESTHQYGTTFDITYTRFDPINGKEVNTQGDLKNLLGEVLYDLRRQGRCLVKYERRSPCYHITVVE
ncbi:MAG: hypothetical protein K2F87_00300 [Muribaculaceae bacterium]|nr:hypothetical protein [Muribaculaceae bacterium]